MQDVDTARQYFSDALRAQEREDHAQAAALLKKALAIVPGRVSVLTNLAAALLKLGSPVEALTHAQNATKLDPKQPDGWLNAGIACAQLERHADALTHFEQALALDPNASVAWVNRGNVQCKLMQFENAVASYRRALQLTPNDADAHCNLGSALAQLNRHDEAFACYERAIAIKPGHADAYYNRGNAQCQLAQWAAAQHSYEQAIACDSHHAQAHMGRGNAQQALQQPAAAMESYERAIALQPDFAEAYNNRGNALCHLRALDAARQSYEQAIALRPTFAEAHSNLGNVLRGLHDFTGAMARYGHAISLDPRFADAYVNRGNLMRSSGERVKALSDFENAIRIEPASAAHRIKHLIAQIPLIPASAHEVAQSRIAFEQETRTLAAWLARDDSAKGHQPVELAQPFYLAYQEQNNRALLQAYGAIGTQLMTNWRARQPPSAPRPMRGHAAKIRVGIASAFIKSHSVWHAFVKGWVEQIDRARFELYLYQLSADNDDETAWARQHATLRSGDRPLAQWLTQITADAPDILIYPEVGMHTTTVQLANLRIAPVQMAAWGHPETTGLSTIDYYLSAADFEPAASQEYFSEQLVALPHLGCYYENPPVAEVDVDPRTLGVSTDRPLYICAGTPFKYAPEHDRVYVEIARRVPRAQFLFFTHSESPPLSHKLFERLAGAYSAAQLDFSHHALLAPWQSNANFRSLLQRADAFLDTIGFSGFNTVMQAVGGGVPVVTLEGQFMRGRFGSAILRRMSLDELVASNQTGYVERAVRLATDRSYNASIRARVRHSCNTLLRDRLPITALEQFFIDAVRRPQTETQGTTL